MKNTKIGNKKGKYKYKETTVNANGSKTPKIIKK